MFTGHTFAVRPPTTVLLHYSIPHTQICYNCWRQRCWPCRRRSMLAARRKLPCGARRTCAAICWRSLTSTCGRSEVSTTLAHNQITNNRTSRVTRLCSCLPPARARGLLRIDYSYYYCEPMLGRKWFIHLHAHKFAIATICARCCDR